MAMAIVSAVFDKLAEAIVGLAAGSIGLPRGVGDEEICKLSSKFEELRGVLDDAEQRQFRDKRIRPWLEKLEDISYDMDNILDEWNTMNLKRQIEDEASSSDPSVSKKRKVLSLISTPLTFMDEWGVRVNIGTRIQKLNESLDFILNEMSQFNLIRRMLVDDSQPWKRDSSSSFVDVSKVYGRDFDKDVLRTKLLLPHTEVGKDSLQIIAITGTGGIGKTTLAQLIYRDDEVKGHFNNQRAWVCVSDPFDNVKVARSIVQGLEGKWPDLDELDPLLNKIMELTRDKRLLLVMDDVWTQDYTKWTPLLESLRHADPGSRILLTTRSVLVAREAGATYIHNLGVLSESDSWLLFSKIAFHGRSVAHVELLGRIGHMILNKCKGLPLAIMTLGSLLRWKDTKQEWQNIADSNIWELEIAEMEVFPHLYLSYDDLPPEMKRCFTFCTIFPKDKIIRVDDLVRLWMAEGCLRSMGDDDDMEKKGEEYFINMSMRSLFQNFTKDVFGERIVSCKMHDIVHDFAQYLTKGKCLVIEDVEKLESGEVIGSDKLRHLTLSRIYKSEHRDSVRRHASFSINGKPRGFFVTGPILREFSTDLLKSLKCVRELRLQHCSLEVPEEIENLIHLRYLELSPSKGVPATIYNLCNLQTLNLSGNTTTNRMLPSGIEKLKSLRNLMCRGYVYPDGLRNLTALKSLTDFTVGRCYNKSVCLETLNQLHGELRIHILDAYVREIGMAKLGLKTCLQSLDITFTGRSRTRDQVNAMEALEPPPYLRTLQIFCYAGTRIPPFITSLTYLKELKLCNWGGLSSISSLEGMPLLEIVLFHNLRELEFVGRTFLGLEEIRASSPSSSSLHVIFPNLKRLKFSLCESWEEWEDISQEEEENMNLSVLPRLTHITISDSYDLKGLPHRLLRKASLLKTIRLGRKAYSIPEVLSRPHNEHWWNED